MFSITPNMFKHKTRKISEINVFNQNIIEIWINVLLKHT